MAALQLPQMREFPNTAAMMSHYASIRAKRLAVKDPSPPKLIVMPPVVAPPVVAPPPLQIVPIEDLAVCLSPTFRIEPDLAASWATHQRPTFEAVMHAVCTHYRVRKLDVMSKRRTADIVRPRQIICYLAKTLLLKSYPEIARRLGGRDHTTAMHSFRKIEWLRKCDDKLADDLDRFEDMLTPPPSIEVIS